MACTSSIEFEGFKINEPSVIPTCIGAALVGFLGYISLSKQAAKNVPGAMVYSFSFFMFGAMMSDAMFVHSFFDQNSTPGLITGLIDVGLTSSVGLSFLYNGLVDLSLIPERSIATISVMFLSYVALFGAWLYSFYIHWQDAFMWLYFGVIMFGCGIYCICEVIYIIKSRNFKGTLWLFAGGISGGIGVLCVFKWNEWFCTELSPFLSGDFWWFLLSDVSMYCLWRFFMSNKAAAAGVSKNAGNSVDMSTIMMLEDEEEGGGVPMATVFYPADAAQEYQMVPIHGSINDGQEL